MSTIATVIYIHNYKYGPTDWRADIAESYQQTKKVHTDYTVVDGQVLRTVETTWEFASAIAYRSVQLPDPPPTFIYVDGTYRADPAYIFQKTHIKTTAYEAYGDTSYLVTIDDFNVLTGQVTHSVSVVDGKIPLAPTQNSALTNLVQQPTSASLEDNCGFVTTTTVINNQYLESAEDAATAARRQMQRDTAIVRRLKHAANPMMKLGDTVQIIDEKRGLDARHILTRRTFTLDANGGAEQVSEFEFWTR